MKYAIVNGLRVEASSEGLAKCPICASDVIAKCGTRRIHHWAHKGHRNCDPWKESETPWHRAWKDIFPSDWQEHPQRNPQTGEIHIADVRTNNGLVIEFQRSPIYQNERVAREQFYKNMFWVVDGTRLEKDFPRFEKGKFNLGKTKAEGYFITHLPAEIFPEFWIHCSVPVVFDYLGLSSLSWLDVAKEPLWCLLPGRADGCWAVVVAMSQTEFVSAVSNRPYVFHEPAPKIVSAFNSHPLTGSTEITSLPGFVAPKRR